MPTSGPEWGDWLPFTLFTIAMMASGVGALLASAGKLWKAATFFTVMFAASVATTLIYGM